MKDSDGDFVRKTTFGLAGGRGADGLSLASAELEDAVSRAWIHRMGFSCRFHETMRKPKIGLAA